MQDEVSVGGTRGRGEVCDRCWQVNATDLHPILHEDPNHLHNGAREDSGGKWRCGETREGEGVGCVALWS